MRKIKPQSHDMMYGGEMSSHKGEKKEFYPHIRLEHKFFPEVKKWEVGKEYTVTLKLKMTGLSISKFQNDSEFDVTGISVGSEK